MNKISLSIILLFSCVCFISCDMAESDFGKEKTFVKFYGDNFSNNGVKAIESPEGGYIVGGYTNIGDTIIYPEIIRTDAFGNLIWQELIQTDTNATRLEDMLITQSGEIALLCTVSKSNGNSSTSDYRLTLIDGNGATIWSQDYDVDGSGLINDEAKGLTQTSDGGFAIIGTTNIGTADLDMYVVKTDADGNIIWDRVYGNAGNRNDRGVAIAELADGTFFWYGTEQTSTASVRLRLVKTNALGNLLQDFNYLMTDPETGQLLSSRAANAGGMEVINSGIGAGVYITGTVDSRLAVIKTDLSGNLEWSLPVDNINGSDLGNDVVFSTEGELLVAGETQVSGEQIGNAYLLRVGITGALIDAIQFGASAKESTSSISETTDKGFVICGTASLDNTNDVMMLLKTDIFGKISE